ncbi:Inner membrane protein YbbJ [Halioglobus japonicus]|nr:Inner membrane protein YbbJ [Halioglobus japonicus]
MELFNQIQGWHWFVLAVVLIVLELTTTTGFLLGIAFAALALSGILWVVPELSWDWQFLSFGVLSVVLTLCYRMYFRPDNDASDNPLLNDRAAQMLGKSFVLGAELDRSGADMIGDTRWALRSAGKIERGARVRVVAVEGMVLSVEEE